MADAGRRRNRGNNVFTGVPGLVIQHVAAVGASYTVAPGLVTGLEYDHSWISHAQSSSLAGNTADLIILVQSMAF